ncbi:MAG: PilZ domain-containing protein [Nitrospiria bacterium]
MADSLSDHGQSDFEGKRQHPRVNVDLKTDFKILSPKNGQNFPEGELEISNTRTLSEGGILFVSRVPLNVGAKVDIRLYFYSLAIEFVAEIVWVKEHAAFGASEYFCGSKFSTISDDNFFHLRNILQSYQTH